MAAPPANAPGPVSGTIAMPIPSYAREEEPHYSPSMRIFGVPWRLVVARVPTSAVVLHLPPFPGHEYELRSRVYHSVQLQCAASAEFELWRVRVRLVMHSLRHGPYALRVHREVHHTFASWQQPCLQLTLHGEWIGPCADAVSVGMWMEADGAKFGSPRQPSIDSLRAYRSDVVLVANGHRFLANKQVLCNAALGFFRIFIERGAEKEERGKDVKGNKKQEKKKAEKELEEVEIDLQSVDPQDFKQVLRMIYGMPTEPITEKSVGRLLSIVDMFDIKFVRDRLENVLLSSSGVTLYAKQTLARVHELEMLKEEVLPSDDLRQNPVHGE